MSFILDALKKSESDRQRQNGPALFEVRVAPPRTRLPLWAIAVALLLVVNLGVVIWMLLRHQEHPATPLASTTAAPVTAPTAPPAAAQPQAVVTSAAPPAATPTPVPVVATSAPVSAGTAPPAATATGAPPAPTPAPPAGESTNAEDYAPAEERAPSPLSSHVRRATDSGVPLYQDLTTTPGTQLPQLRLDLHVFAARPQDRFVMINMHKVREGDTLPEGVHVESITPDGAVLSFNGSKFLLPRD
jgi:general secretion pathway protein B